MDKGTDTRTRILDAAEGLVFERGFTATTVDAVLSATGVSKGAFFHHFASKGALGRALVERYAAADMASLDEALAQVEAASDDPVVQIVELMRAFESGADAVMAAQPTCLFISFIYERELEGAGTNAVVGQAIRYWRSRLEEKVAAAMAAGGGGAGVEPASLADHIFATFEGGFLLARALEDPKALGRELGHLRRYVELLFGRDGGDRVLGRVETAG